jgi:hypothetical protein
LSCSAFCERDVEAFGDRRVEQLGAAAEIASEQEVRAAHQDHVEVLVTDVREQHRLFLDHSVARPRVVERASAHGLNASGVPPSELRPATWSSSNDSRASASKTTSSPSISGSGREHVEVGRDLGTRLPADFVDLEAHQLAQLPVGYARRADVADVDVAPGETDATLADPERRRAGRPRFADRALRVLDDGEVRDVERVALVVAADELVRARADCRCR